MIKIIKKCFFLTLAYNLMVGVCFGKEPWEEWLNWLPNSTVDIQVLVAGSASPSGVFSLAGKTLTVSGSGDCDSLDSSFITTAQLKPLQDYPLTISGVQWKYISIQIVPRLHLPRVSGIDFQSIPKPTKVFANGIDIAGFTNTITLTNTSCAASNIALNIQIRPERGVKPAILGMMEEVWDEDPDTVKDMSPGDGLVPLLGPGTDTRPWMGAIRWGVSLGKLFSGRSAGLIRWYETSIGTNNWKASSLVYTARSTNSSELHVVTNVSGSLRQIKAPQALADIQEGTNQLTIKYFLLNNIGIFTNGLYAIVTNTPFVTWKIRSGSGSIGTNWTQILEERSGRTSTFDLRYETNLAWSLTSGNGSDQRVETRALSISGSNRVETVSIKYLSGVTNNAYSAIESYSQFPWGWELTNVIVNPGSFGLTNQFVFDTNTNSIGYGLQIVKILPGNRWERRNIDPDLPSNLGIGAQPLDIWLKPWLDGPTNYVDSTPENSKTEMSINSTGFYTLKFSFHDPSAYNLDNALEIFAYHYGTFPVLPDGSTPFIVSEESGVVSTDAGARERGASSIKRLYAPGSSLHESVISKGVTVYTSSGSLSGPDGPINSPEATEYTWGNYNTATHSFTPGSTGSDLRVIIYSSHLPMFTSPYMAESPSVYGYKTIHDVWIKMAEKYSTKQVRYLKGGLVIFQESSVLESYDGTTFNWDLLTSEAFSYDSLGHLTNSVSFDQGNLAKPRIQYSSTWKSTGGDDWNLQSEKIDETGIKQTYQYDSLLRITNRTVVQPAVAYGGLPSDISETFVYDAEDRRISRSLNGSGASLNEKWAYDPAGRLLTALGSDGIVTNITYSADLKTITETSPGRTNICTFYLDGRPKAVTGNRDIERHFLYESTDSGIPHWFGFVSLFEVETLGSTNSTRTLRKGYDRAGNLAMQVLPTLSSLTPTTNLFYHWRGWQSGAVTTTVDTDGETNVTTSIAYLGGFDKLSAVATVIGNVSAATEEIVPNAGLSERLRRTVQCYEKTGSSWFMVETNFAYLSSYGDLETIVRVQKVRLNGFSSTNILNQTYTSEGDSDPETETKWIDRSNKIVTVITSSPASSMTASNILNNGYLVTASTLTVASPKTYGYDSLGRMIAVTNSVGGFTTTNFNSYGQVSSSRSFEGVTKTFAYYGTNNTRAGLISATTEPENRVSFFDYNSRRQLIQAWGNAITPEERIYDEFGALTELHTFRGGQNWSSSSWPTGTTGSSDITKWTFHQPTGWLLKKEDANGKWSTNDYWLTGSLKMRRTSRGVSFTNYFTTFGDHSRTMFSDGSSNVIRTNFNLRGSPEVVIDSSGTRNLFYDSRNRAIGEYWTSGPFSGIRTTNSFERDLGRNGYGFITSSATNLTAILFDTVGRVSSVTNGTVSISYSFLQNSDLVSSAGVQENGTNASLINKGWEFGTRLRSVTNTSRFGFTSSYDYSYDANGRRSLNRLADSSFWSYEYNDRGEVTDGSRSWIDSAAVSGQRFRYQYDNIGNRTVSQQGGDTNGGNVRTTYYSPNALNQYTNIARPGYKDVIGIAWATNFVSVNGLTTDRKAEYFHRELTVSNSGGPLWQAVTVINPNATNSGSYIHPDDSQKLDYDEDGNIVFDGVWVYQWDVENRLKQMTMTNVSGIPNSERKLLKFSYDYLGRRTTKQVFEWTTNSVFSSTPSSSLRFIYDGWDLQAQLNSTNNSVIQSYGWGLDVSGTVGEGGGIGGLFYVRMSGTNYFPGYDGNGNVTVMFKGIEKLAATYEYDPFGELICANGIIARSNPFRFSTKYSDDETGLSYYGFRYYSPHLGRWLGRDPIAESDGNNMFAFCRNSTLNYVDFDGREGDSISTGGAGAIGGGMAGASGGAVTGAISGGGGGLVGFVNQRFGAAIASGTGAFFQSIAKNVIKWGVNGGGPMDWERVVKEAGRDALGGAAAGMLLPGWAGPGFGSIGSNIAGGAVTGTWSGAMWELIMEGIGSE